MAEALANQSFLHTEGISKNSNIINIKSEEEYLDGFDRYCRSKLTWAITTFLTALAISLNYNFLALDVAWYIAVPGSLGFSTIITAIVTFSVKWRGIFLICVPEAFSRSGILILTTILYWLAATGPLNNIIHNMSQVSGMVTCTQELVQVQQEQFALAIKQTNEEAVDVLLQAVTKATSFGAGLGDAIEKGTKLITDLEDELHRYTTEKLKYAQAQCNRDFGGAMNQCSNGVDNAYNDCKSKLNIGRRRKRSPSPFFNKIRETFENAGDSVANWGKNTVDATKNTFENHVRNPIQSGVQASLSGICNVIQADQICSSINSLDTCNSLFGGLAGLTDKMRFTQFLSKFRDMFRIKIDHETELESEIMSSLNATAIKEKIQAGINEKVEKATMLHRIIQSFLPLTLLLILLKAWKFHKQYILGFPDSSNLTKKTKKVIIQAFPDSSNLMKKTKKVKNPKEKVGVVPSLKIAVISVLIPLLTFGPILIFEFALAQALFFVGDNLNGTYSFTGGLDFNARVEGGIIMLPIFQQLLDDVQLQHEYEFNVNTDICQPDPVDSASMYTLIAFGIIILVMGVLSFVGQYLLVYRVKILDWVYRN